MARAENVRKGYTLMRPYTSTGNHVSLPARLPDRVQVYLVHGTSMIPIGDCIRGYYTQMGQVKDGKTALKGWKCTLSHSILPILQGDNGSKITRSNDRESVTQRDNYAHSLQCGHIPSTRKRYGPAPYRVKSSLYEPHAVHKPHLRGLLLKLRF